MGQSRADLEIDGKKIASFAEAEGLSEDHREVTLKGASGNEYLQNWAEADPTHPNARKDGSILTFDQTGTEKARWNFKNGWPSAYKGPDLSSDSGDAASEELTIAHEGMERIR